MEEWKIINDYPNYSISNFGNVKNNKKNKLLKGRLNRKGYLRVGLYNDVDKTKNKNFSIHRLVGDAFLENKDNKLSIDHIDRNKQNNNISNLRWATNEEQNRNQKKREGCSSIYKGVSFYKTTNKWVSSITINKKRVSLGYFKTEEEAKGAYNNFIIEKELQEFFILN